MLFIRLGDFLTAIAVRAEDELRVAVPVDKEFEAVRVGELVGEVLHAAHLGFGAGCGAAVGLGAGVVGGADAVPFVGPVAVQVNAPAAVRSVGSWKGRLAVLAP